MIRQTPFFLPLEAGILYASADFVNAANRIGLVGLIEGKTIGAMAVAADPEPARPPLRWVRLKDLRKPVAPVVSSEPVDAASPGLPTPVLDPMFAQSWTECLRVFLELVKSKGGESQLEVGSGAKPKPKIAANVPQPLRVLLEACGGKLSFSYSIEIEGQKFSGYLDLDAKSLKQHKADCKQWAADTWIAGEAEEKAIWLKAIPFAALKNGDYLALDRRAPSDNPPVVYLNHEDSSEMLSPSLGDFLRAWEVVRYVGPEHWVLADYLDSVGHLSGETAAARELRQML